MSFRRLSGGYFAIPAAAALAICLALSGVVAATATLTPISSDPYTNTSSEHQTEVEPDTFAVGGTIVSAFQVGRFSDGGASNIGWAARSEGGGWTHGFLPGTTPYSTPTGPYARVSDPAVAYDAAHGVWLIASLPINASVTGVGVIVNRSTDGGLTWSSPVVVSAQNGTDKDWIVCDDTATSPYFGHCYVEWDDNANGNLIQMSTSADGGLTWGPSLATANNATGIGGQPLVQPNGTVVVPINSANQTSILSFDSVDGGASWGSTVTVSSIRAHPPAGGLRTSPLPSAEIDAAGRVYVVWQDCRFETNCAANDVVLSTSTDGATWTKVRRIPIDAVGSGVDHFIPGLAVDKTTSGSTAHLGLAFYYYPVAGCTASTCQLDVGYVGSTNGGRSWTTKIQLAGPMTLSWLASTTQGRMVGDYMSTSFFSGEAVPVFAVAGLPSGTVFDEAMFAVDTGLPAASGDHLATSDGVVAPPATPAGAAAPAKIQ